jgi:hypothetical protein
VTKAPVYAEKKEKGESRVILNSTLNRYIA